MSICCAYEKIISSGFNLYKIKFEYLRIYKGTQKVLFWSDTPSYNISVR